MSEPQDDATAMAEASPRPEPGMPRWVKAFIAVAALLLVLFVALKFIGGDHGPGRHGGGSPPAAEDGGHRSPVDHTP